MVLLNQETKFASAPYWVSYSAIATLAEAESKIAKFNDTDFKITPEQLENSINSKTKLVMFSANNPSGTIYTENELRALGKVLKNTQIFIYYLMKYMNI